MRTKIDCCTKDCPDRRADPNCHGYCERYLEQKAEYDRDRATIRKKAKLDSDLSGQLLEGVGRAAHKRHLYAKHKKWW